MAKAPIFVVGPPRCGTTLTGRILGGSASIFVPPVEIFFYQAIYRRRAKLGEPGATREINAEIIERLHGLARRKRREKAYWALLDQVFADQDYLARAQAATSYGEILALFMDAQAAHAGKARWGNHVPADLFALEEIFAHFPDAKIILCARHPLDFLTSFQGMAERAERRGKIEKAERSRAKYHPVITAAYWNLCMATGRRALEQRPRDVFVNRYEDLVGDSERQAQRLCEFLEVPFEPAMLELEGHNSSRATKEKGIFKGSVGQWKTKLSGEDVALCQSQCRKGMRYFGYEAAEAPARVLPVARCLLGSPSAAIRALRANTKHTGLFLPSSLSGMAVRSWLGGFGRVGKAVGLAQPSGKSASGRPAS